MEPHETRQRRRDIDELLASALATGKTWEQAAQYVGCSRATVARRLAIPAFRSRVYATRDALVSQAVGRLTAGMAGAADVLVLLLQSDSEAVRLRSATALIDAVVKTREHSDMMQRLESLERPDAEPSSAGEEM